MGMTEREMIVKYFETCRVENDCSTDCPYWDSKASARGCTKELAKDILTLLKEQEAVKPRVSSIEQRCGNCNKVIEMDGWKVCPWCGKPILWEAVGRLVK